MITKRTRQPVAKKVIAPIENESSKLAKPSQKHTTPQQPSTRPTKIAIKSAIVTSKLTAKIATKTTPKALTPKPASKVTPKTAPKLTTPITQSTSPASNSTSSTIPKLAAIVKTQITTPKTKLTPSSSKVLPKTTPKSTTVKTQITTPKTKPTPTSSKVLPKVVPKLPLSNNKPKPNTTPKPTPQHTSKPTPKHTPKLTPKTTPITPIIKSTKTTKYPNVAKAVSKTSATSLTSHSDQVDLQNHNAKADTNKIEDNTDNALPVTSLDSVAVIQTQQLSKENDANTRQQSNNKDHVTQANINHNADQKVSRNGAASNGVPAASLQQPIQPVEQNHKREEKIDKPSASFSVSSSPFRNQFAPNSPSHTNNFFSISSTKPAIPSVTKKPSPNDKINDLLKWCQLMTSAYDNVQVKDFTHSWRNGLAFCALLHRFFPEMVDFASLKEEDAHLNVELALNICPQVGINRLMDPEDIVILANLDRLSMITQISEFYNVLRSKTPKV